MAEQVEGDVAERHVLLQLRGPGDPGAELLRQDEGVVAEPQGVLGDVGARRGRARAGQFLAEPQLVDGDVAVRLPVDVADHLSGAGSRSLAGSLSLSKGHRCGTPSEAV